ncbi:MAG: hypothetical protein Q8K78_04745 [Planctomycetaceae bacterium]|nr:hypothetical protein [Planctomycetaceae bacterium]
MAAAHSIQLDGTRFWVTHRRVQYGPFDYEWSPDFCGVALLYEGRKFGEYCTSREIYADLRPDCLPLSVVQVSSIVMGCVLLGVMHGLTEQERSEMLRQRLEEFGFDRFATFHHS